MKAANAIAAIGVLAIITASAGGADAPDRPAGVSAHDWAPISSTLGVVLVDKRTGAADAPGPQVQRQGGAGPGRVIPGAGGGATLLPPQTGYLMIKRGREWVRLVIIEPIKGPGAAG